MTTTTDLTRARLAAGLEEAARLLRDHPDLPLPYITSRKGGVDISWYLQNEDDLTPDEQAREFLRISARLAPDWEPGYTPKGCKGWEADYGDHLRLVVTYRLAAEATS